MRAVIHYTREIHESLVMAEKAFRSLSEAFGWEPVLRQGFTPKTAPALPVMAGGYLDSHIGIKRRAKIACVSNHIRFWMEVANSETAAFIEHDTECLLPPPEMTHDVLHLSYDTARHSRTPNGHRVTETYNIKNHWHNARLFPGTSAYAITPEGARKLLAAVFTHGLEQSDWLINSKVVDMDHARPSPVRWVENTLNSSGGRFWV